MGVGAAASGSAAADEVYAVRSVRPCRATDNDQVAFGPARRGEC